MDLTVKSNDKLNKLRSIEKSVKEYWEENIPINPEVNYDREKYFITFPYPYMNGKLHLGHAFSITKAEFTARFQKMLGKNVLFPFSFHCTGMPIAACADKLKHEIETFGLPPKFPVDRQDSNNKSKKLELKQGNNKYQWNILASMGISETLIPKFRDPKFWFKYFPEQAINDLKKFGLMVDWRRSFITTDENPYYDSFIKWQFKKLLKNNKLKFGKRYVIYSLKDNGPCADHDRKTGEGVQPQEYTIIKMIVNKEKTNIFDSYQEDVFLAAATLRPETMYGQTNYWIDPNITYGMYYFGQTEIIICSKFSALNLNNQGFKLDYIRDIKGSALIGIPVNSPLTSYSNIYGLPFPFIKEEKGTGIVTSVPSDSPHDYIAFKTIHKNKEYNIEEEWVPEIISFIEVENYGNLMAEKICQDLKIVSISDKSKLEKAHDIVYTKGFYSGKLLSGVHSGKSVIEAKDIIKKELVDSNQAFILNLPDETVISRSDDKCIVKLTDQWFLNYGDHRWKNNTKILTENLETYSSNVKNNILEAVEWLNEWPCSRTYGLGTKMPNDETLLIDSLSDSTIYMAYYTISYLLQGNLDGSELGPYNIRASMLNDSVWDSIFMDNKKIIENYYVDSTKIMNLKHEYMYWYPVDLRVSGKDLINNHLTMSLYNHNEILGANKVPKSYFVNGHLQLNGDKMSKSTGNFLTLEDSINKYSADVTRLVLGIAGDDTNDANFNESEANAMVLKIHGLIEWYENMLTKKLVIRKKFNYFDNVFSYSINSIVNKTLDAFKNMRFREGIIQAFFELQNVRDKYMNYCNEANQIIIYKYMELQLKLLAPIIPHVTQHLWNNFSDVPLMIQGFPQYMEENDMYVESFNYMEDLLNSIRKLQNKKSNLERIKILVSDGYQPWQKEVIDIVNKIYDFEENKLDMKLFRDNLPQTLFSKKISDTMRFANYISNNFKRSNIREISKELHFSEKNILESNFDFLKEKLNLLELEIEVDNFKSEPSRPKIEII